MKKDATTFPRFPFLVAYLNGCIMEIWKDVPGTRPACKSRLNRKFQENNSFGTKNETFCSLSQK